MKKVILLLLVSFGISLYCNAYNLVNNSKFVPLSYEEIYMAAMAKAAYDRQQKERFEYYQDKAYECYNRQDWYGFLTYSNYALETGWYNSKLYFDRGVVYEKLNDFKNAKKEYKKAKKEGYAYAETALRQLKEKEYKRLQKLRKK